MIARNKDREKDQGNAQDQFADVAVRGAGEVFRGGGRLLTQHQAERGSVTIHHLFCELSITHCRVQPHLRRRPGIRDSQVVGHTSTLTSCEGPGACTAGVLADSCLRPDDLNTAHVRNVT